MKKTTITIACTVTVHVSVPGELPVPLPAEFTYCATDPYAVSLTIGTGNTRPVRWTFSRELLAEGLGNPTGMGDVLVRPRMIGGRRFADITLKSMMGTATLLCPIGQVAPFLRQTFTLVPKGSEEQHIDLDSVVLHLMQR